MALESESLGLEFEAIAEDVIAKRPMTPRSTNRTIANAQTKYERILSTLRKPGRTNGETTA
jgi:hypothetical protein